MNVIENKLESKRAVHRFRERLQELAHAEKEASWVFPNGTRRTYQTYSIRSYLGEIQIGLPEKWESRIPHLIRFSAGGGEAPQVELNIPTELDRSVSGVYVKSKEDYILCSRGSFTAFRTPIKRATTLEFFDSWAVEINDGGKLATVIPVCSLESDALADDIATFVATVRELKDSVKENSAAATDKTLKANSDVRLRWGLSDEFEGTKSTGSGKTTRYEYRHGPLCNQLLRFLRSKNPKESIVQNNKHVDAAIVCNKTNIATSIFEVKTASLPDQQIYTAVGQLLYYDLLYGKSNARLYLVLPMGAKCSKTESFVATANISVVYGEGSSFFLSSGEKLTLEI